MSTTVFSEASVVAYVITMGSRWRDDNRGGFYFGFPSNMPSGIEYFIVKPMDVGLELFFTQLMTAMGNNRAVRVEYVVGGNSYGGKKEGDVVALHSN